jgi:DNA-binding NarL/FixJ family response regulator
MTTKILIADDHKILREGLCSLLEEQSEFQVVGEAENGRDAVYLATKLEPDVVVIDIAMPDLNGIEAARRIKKASPGVKLLALSAHSEGNYVKGMIQNGASGYLLKDCASEELIKAIEVIVRGHIYLSPSIAGVIVDDYVQSLSTSGVPRVTVLTSREREVLQMLTEGNSTVQMAERIHLSVKTVESHRRSVMKMLDLSSVAELTKYAIREGITSLED